MNSYTADYNSRFYGAICYFTWIGFLAALVLSARDDAFVKKHQNQSLVLNVFGTAAAAAGLFAKLFLPYIIAETVEIAAGTVGVIIVIGWIVGWISAASGRMYEAPIFGNLHWTA